LKYFFTLLLIAISSLTLITGETPLKEVITPLLNGSTEWNPLVDERLPRLIVLICTGASLAVSGAVMQALFHNPLASPSVLGVSCGGSLFVVIVFALELNHKTAIAVPIGAFLGALSTLLIVYNLSRRNGRVELNTLILTGIALSTLLLAIQGAIMYALRDKWQLIQMLTEWEAGSTADRSWKHVHMQLPLTLVALLVSFLYRKEIDILALGEEEAKNLGVEVKKVRWRLFLCVALLTGGAIAGMGIIAFFGLVLPHLLRRFSGPSNKQLIPLCMLGGSACLTTLDFLLRFFSIHAFSIGNVSAVLGGLFFLLLLFKTPLRTTPC
jgi:iron complex transport system permease protein